MISAGELIRNKSGLLQLPLHRHIFTSAWKASGSREVGKGGWQNVVHFPLTPGCSCLQDFYSSVLDILTPDDVRVLVETEDEYSRRGQFERVFPTHISMRYLRFFEQPRYFNILVTQWEQKYYSNKHKGKCHPRAWRGYLSQAGSSLRSWETLELCILRGSCLPPH